MDVDEDRIERLTEDLFLGTIVDGGAFSQIVLNKPVAMVATSSHIRGKGFGPEIDSGLVMRFSTCLDMAPFDDELAADIGYRNDLYYIIPSFLKTFVSDLEENARKCAACGVQSLMVNFVDTKYEYMGTWKNIKIVEEELRRISAPTRINHCPVALSISRELLLAAGGHKKIMPRGGFQALVDLVLHGASKVKTRGMTFYHGGDNFSRPDSVKELDPKLYHHGQKQNKHDSKCEVLVVNRMWRMEPHLFDFDPVFQEIVEGYDR